MKISGYTFVKNGIWFDYHVKHSIAHNARLFDEFIIVYSDSDDGTYEAIDEGIKLSGSKNVKIVKSEWKELGSKQQIIRWKSTALKHITGNWAIFLDVDEFLPDWEMAKMKEIRRTQLQMEKKQIVEL